MIKFWMCNVVWYDGSAAFVSKFILQSEDDEITEDSKRKVRQYLNGNGEVLKIDPLFTVDFDNIVALKTFENSTSEYELEQFAAYDRFKNMWF